mgnify:CR=1 FL=1
MNMLGRIRRMHLRDGLTISEIERRTGLTRKAIRNWLKKPEGTEPKYRRQTTSDTKITPYAERLIKMLEVDARRLVRERRTGRKLFAVLKTMGFDGDYSRVTEFIRRWRVEGGTAVTKAYVPLLFEPGEAHQFDWSEERLVIGGVWRKVLAAHLKLCHSKAFVVQAYPTQSHEMLFDAHAKAFAALGGIPRRGIYDNMKTAVDKVKKGKARVVNTRFAAMASHYLFDPDFCNVASGWGEAGFRNACVAPPQPARPTGRAVGRGARAWSRRTSRTVGDASGRKPPRFASVPSPSSISGSWPAAAASGRN